MKPTACNNMQITKSLSAIYMIYNEYIVLVISLYSTLSFCRQEEKKNINNLF